MSNADGGARVFRARFTNARAPICGCRGGGSCHYSAWIRLRSTIFRASAQKHRHARAAPIPKRALHAAPDSAAAYSATTCSCSPGARGAQRLWTILTDALEAHAGEVLLTSRTAPTRASDSEPARVSSDHGLHGVYERGEPVSYTLSDGAVAASASKPRLRARTTSPSTTWDHLRERGGEGMFSVFVDRTLAGFIGTHDERSMGLLGYCPNTGDAASHSHSRTPHQPPALDQAAAVLPVRVRNAPSIALQRQPPASRSRTRSFIGSRTSANSRTPVSQAKRMERTPAL